MIRPRSRCAPARSLQLETLEDRRLLSASAIALPTVTVGSTNAADHILVRFREGAAPTPLAGTTIGKALALVSNLYDVQLSAKMTVDQALAAYRKDGLVAYAEADVTLSVASIPNDPQFGQQWDLSNTGQEGGTVGADIKATAAYSVVSGVKQIPIAVFDSGIDYTHRDLYLNIWINQKEIPASRSRNLVDYNNDGFISMRDLNDPRNQGVGKITDLNANGYIDGGDLLKPMSKDTQGNDTGLGGWADGISQDGSGYIDDLIGWNSNANNNNPMDGYGHGTHVAGTIGAIGNNGLGVAGIDWNAQLVPVKFFDDSGNGSVTQFIAGLTWALAHGIKISNNSWNDGGYTPALFDAVKAAQGQGHLFVAAAGNSGRNTDTQPAYPADFILDNVVSVAATDRYNNLAGFSNFGVASVAIAAPGVDILSTNPGNNYGLRTGTSMATPHVTAVAAEVWALHPDWNYHQVIAQVLNTATRLPSLNGKVASGLLDFAAAVGVSQTAPTPSALRLVDSQAGGAAGTISKITVKFDSAPPGGVFPLASVSVKAPDGSPITVTGMTLVPGSSGLRFDLTFAVQTKPGYYKLHVGPAAGDTSGNLAVFDSSLYLAPN